ncbi:protein-glutamine gamma-glutamyltransferase 2 isoform X2 [Clupea harengus]|uniref:Protein-glutamine gamma-glutamyltransferase 2 isoform X2 n=1 Tax=Clupea harengus TaxID=7950 RepID=A0A8M1KN25_CLUHA|nr:protein-glutamine gamma-glutamyltransferase 2 isoform X2 [Clupea harengus]
MSPVLDVNRVDLDHAINHKDHQTDFSEPECLFVRRGQIFTISLHLNSGQYNEGKDTLTITAEIGAQPSENDGTRAVFRVSDTIDEASWGAKASSRTAGVLTLSISSAPSAPIGHYTLFLDQEGQRQVKLGQFVLLYNPWCPRDSVYLDDEDKLEEYVLSQDGLIYVINLALPWIFGQFQQGILDICLKLLGIDPAGVQGCGATGNPVYVTRLLSGLIHKHVLWGNWNDTSDGVNPEEWQSSVEILQRWDMEKSLVRYGQCWVFAAVNCTGMIVLLGHFGLCACNEQPFHV